MKRVSVEQSPLTLNSVCARQCADEQKLSNTSSSSYFVLLLKLSINFQTKSLLLNVEVCSYSSDGCVHWLHPTFNSHHNPCYTQWLYIEKPYIPYIYTSILINTIFNTVYTSILINTIFNTVYTSILINTII